jgi:GMP synthase-like glutamine amidotransferase
MKPIAVFQHTEIGAPGSVLSILEDMGRTVQLVRVVEGHLMPVDAAAFGGLVFMGGSMSVHDPLPWIAQALALIRDADAKGVPVAGHCLGSQLVALALGGQVHRHVQAEIGWREITADACTTAREWWGEHAGQRLQTFQWHGDTYLPPAGAVRIAHGEHCANQAHVLHGRHLLLQSHLEMTPLLVEMSMRKNGSQLRRENARGNPAASDHADLLGDLPQRTQRMHVLLRQLYTRWLAS